MAVVRNSRREAGCAQRNTRFLLCNSFFHLRRKVIVAQLFFGGGLFFLNAFFYKKLKNISCEYDRWVVETQLYKLRDTSDTLIGRACAMLQLKYGVRE